MKSRPLVMTLQLIIKTHNGTNQKITHMVKIIFSESLSSLKVPGRSVGYPTPPPSTVKLHIISRYSDNLNWYLTE